MQSSQTIQFKEELNIFHSKANGEQFAMIFFLWLEPTCSANQSNLFIKQSHGQTWDLSLP